MKPRSDLQDLLVDLLGSDNVYFQPPPTIRLQYPCIVYKRDNRQVAYANNSPYKHDVAYLVTVMDRDPDSDIPDKVAAIPGASFDRSFTADNLNHDVYTLFF